MIEFTYTTPFSLPNEDTIIDWLQSCCKELNYSISQLSYIFCTDSYVLALNKEHLNHDYYTDILTFDLSESPNIIESDIYISVDRASENADILNISLNKEIYRLLIHGLLHLCGYNDTSSKEKREMTIKEDYFLNLLKL